jgi:hypothetical protein
MKRSVASVLLALAAVAFGALPAAAQLIENLGALTAENAKKYLEPLPEALSGTMNSAIFTTGNVPVTGINFSIGIKVMGVSLGSQNRVYTPTDPPGFTSVPPVQQAPTVIGTTQAVAQGGQGGATVYYPGGFDVDEFAFAAPQVSIGSVLGTRAVVRWYSQNFGAHDLITKVKYFGVGGQHSISQYFTTLPFDLALGAFYQELKLSDKLIDSKTYHVDLTGSKSYAILQPYGAIGFDSMDMDAEYEDATNPGSNIAVHFDRTSHLHLTAGVQAKLAFVLVHAEANLAAINGLAVGLSFGY